LGYNAVGSGSNARRGPTDYKKRKDPPSVDAGEDQTRKNQEGLDLKYEAWPRRPERNQRETILLQRGNNQGQLRSETGTDKIAKL
jgi:hypothetical protein